MISRQTLHMTSPLIAMIATLAAMTFLASPCVAAQKIESKPGFIKGISKTKDLRERDLRTLRKRMISHRNLNYRQLQRLADKGDGLAAMNVGKALYDRPELANDATHYFAIAVGTGRASAIKPLVAVLRNVDLKTISAARLNEAERSLTAHVAHGNIDAIRGLSNLYASGHPFLDSQQKLIALRRLSAANGDGQAALDIAISLMSSAKTNAEDRLEIRNYLKIASGSSDMKISTVARSILLTFEDRNKIAIKTNL
jgi:hypothetical protein